MTHSPDYIRCISLWRPWAGLCVMGAKKFETRHWSTTYRGVLLIHAAKRKMNGEAIKLVERDDFPQMPPMLFNAAGVIVGSVELVQCWTIEAGHLDQSIERLARPLPTGRELLFGNYEPGRFAWELANPRQFDKPIPFTGRQGFFNAPAELVSSEMLAAEMRVLYA